MAIEEPKPWRQTPLIESSVLSNAAGWYVAGSTLISLSPSPLLPSSHGSLNRRSRIFLKLENLQVSGSFKGRGIGLYCTEQLRRAARPDTVCFYASSAGNAGLACVHAAKVLGRPAIVVAPTTTTPVMVAKLRAAGASDVIQHGASWRDADTHMREVVMRRAVDHLGQEPVYVPPFDHETIWRGHSSIIGEVHEQLRDQGESPPDVIACSVGGGGLLTGLMQGMAARGPAWDHTTALAVETRGADSFAQSLDAGRVVVLPGISSIATSLGCVHIAQGVFDLAQQGLAERRLRYAVLSDAEAAMGCWRLADDERILIEPACGVTVALAYGGRLRRALGREVRPDEKVVIVLCGGSNVSLSMLEMWRQQYGDLDRETTKTKPFVHVSNVPSVLTAPMVATAPTPA